MIILIPSGFLLVVVTEMLVLEEYIGLGLVLRLTMRTTLLHISLYGDITMSRRVFRGREAPQNGTFVMFEHHSCAELTALWLFTTRW